MFKTTSKNISINDEKVELEVRGSKFLSYIYYVRTEKEVEDILKEISKEHKQANHIVYSFNILSNMDITKYSDAGEPLKTAGYPIYNIIKERKLKNILIIVVRYFGGTLLGKGGLVKAYTDAACMALEKSGLKYMSKGLAIKMKIGYSDLDLLNYVVENINKEYRLKTNKNDIDNEEIGYNVIQNISIEYLENPIVYLFLSYDYIHSIFDEKELIDKSVKSLKDVKSIKSNKCGKYSRYNKHNKYNKYNECIKNIFFNRNIQISELEIIEEKIM